MDQARKQIGVSGNSRFLLLLGVLIASAAPQEHQVISLKRTACYGSCPEYSLRIDSSGTVSYEGMGYVARKGNQTSTITTSQFGDLVEAFVKIRFFELHDKYEVGPGGEYSTDQPTAFIGLIQNDRTKIIKDYDHAPPELRDLEWRIERTVNVHRWLHDNTKRLTLSSPDPGPWSDPIEDLKNESIVWADVHARIKPGMTLLMQAAGERDTAGIHSALEYGETINAVDETGWTALMIASVSIKPEAVSVLLNSGAKVDQRDGHGDTALIGAAAVRLNNMEKEPEILRMLLAKGASVDATNDLGETALMWAAKSGNPEGVEFLLKAGANPRKRDQAGHDALFYLTRARSRARGKRYEQAAGVLEQALKQR